MSSLSAESLTRENILKLLQSIGSEKVPADENITAEAFDLRQPHYFNRRQLAALNDFTSRLANILAEKFSSFFNTPFEVKTASVSQHYAGFLFDKKEGKIDNYSLAINDKGGKSCGIVVIPQQTASLWLSLLLGESESTPQSQNQPQSEPGPSLQPSHLEQSLLFDMTSIFIRSLFAADNRCDFQPAQKLVIGPASLNTEPTDETCRISLEIKKVGSENPNRSDVIVCSKHLAPIVGKTIQAKTQAKPEENKKIIIEHLGQLSVPVTAWLGTAYLTIEQILSLRINDVILLDKKIDQAVELALKARKIFEGRLARENGKKAFVVTSQTV